MAEWSMAHAWKTKRASNTKPSEARSRTHASDFTFQTYRSV
jgi:hypothetical protein